MIGLRPRLGLGISRRRVSAVLVDGGVVKWAASRARPDDEPLAHALGALLAACPRSRWRPPVVVAAVGPAAAQLKLVADLPPLTEPGTIAAVVREQASRFFLKNGVPLVFSGARATSPTSAWVAAFEEPVVRDVAAACHDAGLTLHVVTPTAVALQFATPAATVVWRDDDIELAVTYADGAPSHVRTSAGQELVAETTEVAQSFVGIGQHASVYLEAAGATRVPRREPIVLAGSALRLTQPPSRRRLVAAGAACAAAVIVALLTPVGASIRVEHAARSKEAAVHTRVSAAERDARELGVTTAALGTLASFSQSRRSLSLLLAQLTRALPEGSALIAVQVDSAGTGSVVAIGPHAAAVVDAVERVPGLASPEIVGPVTRETAGAKQVDRVTVRFHVVPGGAP